MHLIWLQGIQKWSFVAGERKVADYGKPCILYGGVWILSSGGKSLREGGE